jgi:hypothetical protein
LSPARSASASASTRPTPGTDLMKPSKTKLADKAYKLWITSL